MADTIFFKSDDATGVSQVERGLASVKFPDATVVDTAGCDNTAIVALIDAIDAGSQDNIVVCIPFVDSHAEGQFTTAQGVLLIAKLVTANQGTNVTGTAQANSTVTNIKLAAADTGADDAYNLMLIATDGDVNVTRLITDYVESTKVATVTTTSTAVDASETYIIYTTSYLHIVGHDNGTVDQLVVAFSDLFPNALTVPLLAAYMTGYSTVYEKVTKTATSVAAGTLTDTGEFTLAAYDDGDYWVAIESATTGGGQMVKIASNTANILTLSENWPVTPTGTVVYQIVNHGVNGKALWNKYLPYAIATFLWEDTDAVTKIWKKMLDRYGDLYAGGVSYYQDIATIEEYVDKGKQIAEAVWKGVVS